MPHSRRQANPHADCLHLRQGPEAIRQQLLPLVVPIAQGEGLDLDQISRLIAGRQRGQMMKL